MKVHIMRNGESVVNSTEKDTSLTDKGILQSKNKIGHFDVVICSPLLKAKQTLENSGITYTMLIITSLCREVLTGSVIKENRNINDFEKIIQTDSGYTIFGYQLGFKKNSGYYLVDVAYFLDNGISIEQIQSSQNIEYMEKIREEAKKTMAEIIKKLE